jgi:hypothetical protein
MKKGKRMGRPPTGYDPLVALRLPGKTIAWLDRNAKEQKISRSKFMRQIITERMNEVKKE